MSSHFGTHPIDTEGCYSGLHVVFYHTEMFLPFACSHGKNPKSPMETDLIQSVFVEINMESVVALFVVCLGRPKFIRCYAIRHWPCAEIPKFIRCYAIRYWPLGVEVCCEMLFDVLRRFAIRYSPRVPRFVVRCGRGCRGLLLDVI